MLLRAYRLVNFTAMMALDNLHQRSNKNMLLHRWYVLLGFSYTGWKLDSVASFSGGS